jgi:hypothetical protein
MFALFIWNRTKQNKKCEFLSTIRVGTYVKQLNIKLFTTRFRRYIHTYVRLSPMYVVIRLHLIQPGHQTDLDPEGPFKSITPAASIRPYGLPQMFGTLFSVALVRQQMIASPNGFGSSSLIHAF